MATKEEFDRTIALLQGSAIGSPLLDVQIGICIREPRYMPWSRDLTAARWLVRSKSWIVGVGDTEAFAMVGGATPEINYQGHAATAELSLAIAALLSREAELLEEE